MLVCSLHIDQLSFYGGDGPNRRLQPGNADDQRDPRSKLGVGLFRPSQGGNAHSVNRQPVSAWVGSNTDQTAVLSGTTALTTRSVLPADTRDLRETQ